MLVIRGVLKINSNDYIPKLKKFAKKRNLFTVQDAKIVMPFSDVNVSRRIRELVRDGFLNVITVKKKKYYFCADV